MRVRWIETTMDVYQAIFRTHREGLTVYSTFSNPSPSELSMQPQMETTWCFKDANAPLIRVLTKWDDGERDTTETTQFWLASNSLVDQ